jgi:hypothetical protein
MSNLLAKNFRTKEERLTQERVKMVFRYVIYCYQKMISEGKTYKKTDFLNEAKTRFNLEERLSEKLVKDYLGVWDNKKHYKRNISDKPGVEIYFNLEPKQSYTENDTIKDDFIDIKVQETGISNIWGAAGIQEEIHLTIECKVIENGYSDYVSDIKKICDRPYNTPRLNFEGQVAFITNSNYSHILVKDGINKNLSSNNDISTSQLLDLINLTPTFDASYLSKHIRNHNKQSFEIYHLMLDYSKVVLN